MANSESLYKLPDKIKVGGVWYKIVVKEKFEHETSNAGYCDNMNRTITLAKEWKGITQCIEVINEVLLHEVIHSIDHIYCGSSLKESTVLKVSRFLYQVFADNNLMIHEGKVPSEVRVLGHKFDIINEYEFEGGSGIPTDTIVKSDYADLNILLSKDMKDITYTHIALLGAIMDSIMSDVFFSDEELEAFNGFVFCNGLYQVIVDNRIDEFIRQWRGY